MRFFLSVIQNICGKTTKDIRSKEYGRQTKIFSPIGSRDHSISPEGRDPCVGADWRQAGDSHQHWSLLSPAEPNDATHHSQH